MQFGSRFTEYGLTGGFFWICQLFFLTLLRPAKNLAVVSVERATKTATRTNTVLDLANRFYCDQCPSYYRGVCGRVTARSIGGVLPTDGDARLLSTLSPRNRDWLGQLIADHKGYCEADYEEFERLYRGTPVAKAGFFSRFRFWNREQRPQSRALRKLVRSYERLWSFFTSYVLVQSGSSQLSLMVDQYYLWRTGRAVSVSMVILFFEITYFWYEQHWLLRFVLPIVLAFASFRITKALYSRLCFTLFALVYVTQDKAQRGI